MISFSTGKTEKKNFFGQMINMFSFSIAQTEKNPWKILVKQIGENI
jgi:hypothetical protein